MDIGFIASLLTIIGVIIGFIFGSKRWIDEGLAVLGLPTTPDFYVLTFFSLVAAALGGTVWAILNRATPYLGGTSSEPHGMAAIIWSIATMAPVVITLVIIGWKYHFPNIRYQLLLSAVFLIGVTIGSIIFYDLPLDGTDGFRSYFDSQHMSYLSKEFWLVLIWSSLLSFGGLLAVELTKIIVTRTRDFRILLRHSGTLLGQTILCVGLTSLAVLCFLLVFPDQSRFDTARGIIAGLALRMTLFFGLLIGIGANAVQLNPLVVFRITRPQGTVSTSAAPQPPANSSAPGSPP